MSSRSQRSIKGTPKISSASRSFHIESLGCAKNQVDSELMIAALQRAGWHLAENPESAEVLIVNTCGFISAAKTESIETALGLKDRFPGKRVIMAGCLTERYGRELARHMPEIDGFIGNKDPRAIVSVVEKGRGAVPPTVLHESRTQRLGRTRLLSFPGSAYLKVAEGCANRCTYCAIPLIRGDLVSKSIESVLEEIRSLLDQGVKELVLVAQDLGSYGLDRGRAELPRLLRAVSAEPRQFWMRLLYIHPDRFPREILDVMAGDPRFLPYFDLPFQHASPRILATMGRRGDAEANLRLLEQIRRRLAQAVIRSTFLLGFPGESEKDFQLLLDFQRKACFTWLGAFTYSREEDTPAYAMTPRVPAAVARMRMWEIESRQVPITEKALEAHVGETLDVLVEERVEGEDLSIGRAYLHAPDVDGLVVVRKSLPPGRLVRARTTRRNGVDLEAEVVAESTGGAGREVAP